MVLENRLRLQVLCKGVNEYIKLHAPDLLKLPEGGEWEKTLNGELITGDAFELKQITNFLQKVSAWNAASPMGTLEFVDQLAKMNTTNVICYGKEIKSTNDRTFTTI